MSSGLTLLTRRMRAAENALNIIIPMMSNSALADRILDDEALRSTSMCISSLSKGYPTE